MTSDLTASQYPTRSVVLPYTDSLGTEAVAIYERSGRGSLEWQQILLEDIMALDANGQWLHMKFGWSVPRRNGKSEVLIMRAIYALTHGERTLYTAHRTTTSSGAWEKIFALLQKAGYKEDTDFRVTRRYGAERIDWLDGDGVIHFRTRSAKGGLGEGYDLLIIDEAQEYTADQESALKYVVTDSKNPQTLMCGTPPTVVSSGTVFMDYRNSVLTGAEQDAGWAEWSVDTLSDAHDPRLWYRTNPSLGTILTERKIRSELGDDQVDDNIQRLGLWLKYNQKSAITSDEWDRCKPDALPTLAKPHALFYGVKYGKESGNVSLAVAVKTADGKVFVESIDCRPIREGNAWMIDFLRSKPAQKVVIDGAGNQNILEADMKNAGVKCKAILPRVTDVIEANAMFEKQLFDGQIQHNGQPSLAQAVSNCEHRAIGSGGGFGYSAMFKGVDISLLESLTLAHWACVTAKPKKAQVIQY